MGGARPAAGPAARVQDVQGRGRACCAGFADDAARSYPRVAGLDERFVGLQPDLLDGVTRRAAPRTPSRGPPRPSRCRRSTSTHVAPVRVSVADAVEELVDELPRAGRITFRRLTSGLVERLEVIVRFLAVLELFKQGLVELDQPATFGDIEIVWIGPAVGGAELALAGIDSYEG